MWKFSLAWLLCAGLSGGLAADSLSPDTSPMFDHLERPPSYDQDSLRAEVEETQPLLDSLARETRGLTKTAKEEVLKSLRMDYNLGDQVGTARKTLDLSESVLDIQAAIKAQQARMKQVSLVGADGDREESKLLGLQSDLITTVAEVRRQLSDQQRDMNAAETRDLRNWMMVSEGLLRHRREDAEAAAAAHPAPTPEPISAAGVSPGAAALSPAAAVGGP